MLCYFFLDKFLQETKGVMCRTISSPGVVTSWSPCWLPVNFPGLKISELGRGLHTKFVAEPEKSFKCTTRNWTIPIYYLAAWPWTHAELRNVGSDLGWTTQTLCFMPPLPFDSPSLALHSYVVRLLTLSPVSLPSGLHATCRPSMFCSFYLPMRELAMQFRGKMLCCGSPSAAGSEEHFSLLLPYRASTNTFLQAGFLVLVWNQAFRMFLTGALRPSVSMSAEICGLSDVCVSVGVCWQRLLHPLGGHRGHSL